MIEDGADIIDLGVESTRPGSTPIDGRRRNRAFVSINRSCIKCLYSSRIYRYLSC